MDKEGLKFSKDKLPMYTTYFVQFPKALKEVVKCSQAGHKKYIENDENWLNYKKVPNAIFEYKNAAIRHLDESGINKDMLEYGTVLHEAQVIWNLLAALELQLEKK